MSSKNVLTKGKKQRALGLFQEQRFKEAAELYEQICRTDPRDAQAWCALSTLYGLLEDPARSTQCAERAIAIAPNYTDAHHNLSAAYLMLRELEKAEASARRVLRNNPERSDSWINLGHALRMQNRNREALVAYQTASRLNPGDTEAHVGMGEVCTSHGQFEEALGHYRRALALNSRLPGAYSALGGTLILLGREDAAIDAYRQALALQPDCSIAWKQLGKLQMARGNVAEAIASLERAQRHAIGDLSPQLAIAYALAVQGRHDEALEIVRDTIRRDPRLHAAQQLLVFLLNGLPDVDPTVVFSEHLKWGQHCVQRPPLRSSSRCEPKEPLRIGYVSADFREHSVAFFIEPVLTTHDRAKFEIYCYAANVRSDSTTDRLRRQDLHWRKIHALSDAEAAQLIEQDQIDILLDLGGHTTDSRLALFARKPAPVQVTYLGYPNTTGLAEIDYRITDDITDPPDQDRFYTERLLRLSGGFLCYRPPDNAPSVEASPQASRGYITFGSFNASHKINGAVVHLWSKVLERVPRSRLLLKNKALRDQSTQDLFLAQFEAHGISREQISFSGWADNRDHHLALYHQIDIALDTFPYNGTTTTCEALWMGVPVIALAGDRHVARVGMSLLSQVGLSELIAKDEDEFVQLAAALAADSARLAQLRKDMRQRVMQSPLCDAAGFTRKLEEAYLRMWREACARHETQTAFDQR